MVNPYPDSALNAYIHFSNENLPLPKLSWTELEQEMERHLQATLNEAKTVIALLSDEEILAYGQWLDHRIQNEVDCIIYQGKYFALTDSHRIIECYPREAIALLEDENPVLKNLKHKTSHRASAILNYGLENLDEQIRALHERLAEAFSQD